MARLVLKDTTKYAGSNTFEQINDQMAETASKLTALGYGELALEAVYTFEPTEDDPDAAVWVITAEGSKTTG